MGFKDLSFELAYESGENTDDLLESFYVPALEVSNKYFRIAGYFSSTALAIAATGIEGLIHNNGEMYLLVSPELSVEDYRIIQEHGQINEHMDMFSDFCFGNAPDEHLSALAWLLDSGKLKIKIVVPKRGHMSLFHEKIGIMFDDDGNMVSFSGSINETAQAWLYNIEEFKVFCSWKDGQVDYLNKDLKKFLDYWKGNRKALADVYEIPQAIKDKIISIKPRDLHDLRIMERYTSRKKANKCNLELFPHQAAMVQAWVDNHYSILAEMATGTGKTRSAIGCMVRKLQDNEQLAIIISTPQNTLSRQWLKDFKNLGIVLGNAVIIDGTNPKWRRDLEYLFLDMNTGVYSTAAIFTTHRTSSNPKFTDVVNQTKGRTKVLFICDEVHAVATEKQEAALDPCYEYRIGLSATPNRMFDDTGTRLIRNYFGNHSFEFTISDALNTINPKTHRPFLNSYEYHPLFVELSDDEYAEYKKKSKLIAIEMAKEDPDEDRIKELRMARAVILKNAVQKYDVLEQLISELGAQSIKDTLLFVSDKQIENCMEILANHHISRAKITEEESASKVVNMQGETERQKLISDFSSHRIQMLLAIKCLDEGIDIPNARIAFLMSNGTNPREYIQRIGRVIRQSKDKPVSHIYDFVAMAPARNDTSILYHEARRAQQIAQNAVNYHEVANLFLSRGVDIDAN